MKMKKTEYTTLVSNGFFKGEKWQRVYQDENGERYIKQNGEWKNIENTPCINNMVKD